ncbi:YaiO family outer membrane beta-barrel protein [uncultured Lutibacter sp.]|uniref:YaiO family outer membrane beta-barrel protein n=1 Tax=uncultured Lutibacter sp. TaxID=437739 RepID=UPI0026224296|nr:YaiO family outer membrane beta-barrel protein [uncultured Lutibacter sp.]
MLSKSILKLLSLLLFISVYQSFAQQKVFNGNPDTAFEKARELAFNKQRKQAQDSLLFILTKYPDYLDIRSFLASTYSWDGAYKKARKEFSYVLNKDAKRKTDWIAAINNELWGEVPFNALELVNKALDHYPKDVDILLLKAKAEENSNNPEEALQTVKAVLRDSPENQKAKEYKQSLINGLSFNTIGFNSSIDLYSKNERDPMQYHTIKYGRQTKYGSITAKVNFNRRFQTNGVQYELDMYPKISKGLYAYVSAGVSNTSLFPSVRYGAELYKSLPKSFEISLGFRGLKYTETTTIYTSSVGWYTGNSYWSFRTYITPGDGGSSKSGTLNYRKYRSDAENYFSISAGIGFSPEIDPFPLNENEEAIFDLKSQKFNVGYYFTSNNKQHAWGTKFSLSHEEKSFSLGDYYLFYSLGVSYNVKFK